ncbi:glycoside hydrolase family 72 protein [Daldinia vernicosa]|uniref:glycoside hydrolase family 72 protein n=1 Tax=Daldinia vernicosa TaxID=114800 RepID=UPI00200772AE|nr:glycoside hydrolase family 72 protein [Daldinia vernicosa]KAI0853916.1 glycoside hydrolase family 72 protein [Daldinia vernicosa]
MERQATMEHSITPVTIQGRYFWKGNIRFIMNGVVYKSHVPLDILADNHIKFLEHDIPLLRALKINTIFVSHIDGTKSHKACMNLLAENEIYVLVSIGSPVSLFTFRPLIPYTSNSMQDVFQVVENLASYPNLLGFTILNEPIKDLAPEAAGPVIRAIVRDTRRYVSLLAGKKHQRAIPVGVFLLQTTLPLEDQFEYSCSGKDNETVDFFVFNYVDFGIRTPMQTPRESDPLKIFSNTHIPVSFVYCDDSHQYLATRSIYLDPDMRRVFSGGIVHQFFGGLTQDGLVGPKIASLGSGRQVRCERKIDYFNLLDSVHAAFQKLPASIMARSRLLEAIAMSGRKPRQPDPKRNLLALGQVPASPVNWTEVEACIIDESEWVDAGKELLELSVDDLVATMWDKLNIDEADP